MAATAHGLGTPKMGAAPPADESRGAWNSKVGFILASVGAAVGLGNLVLFPYRAATNGGAAFVLIYIGMLFVVGIPALLAELAIGRRFRLNPFGSFREAGQSGGGRGHAKWIGAVAIITSLVLLSYYTVITGWALDFFLRGFTGSYFDDPVAHFGDVAEGPYTLLLHLLVMGATIAIVAPGISKGIERATTIMIPVLFVFLLGITIYGLFQSGAGAGLSFFLRPDFSEVNARSFADAAGQTFFSIGIGFGLMVTYASYMSRDSDLAADGSMISFSDLAIAMLGGLMVFPIVFTFGLQGELSASSVGMLFMVVPAAFNDMGPAGYVVAVVFFLALVFAALSSAIALLEVATATIVDELGTSRPKAAILAGLVAYTLGIGSALSLDFLGRMDVLMANVLLIASGLALSIFAGWFFPDMAKEIDAGSRFRVGTFTVWMLRIVVPIVLLVAGALAAADTCTTFGGSEAFCGRLEIGEA